MIEDFLRNLLQHVVSDAITLILAIYFTLVLILGVEVWLKIQRGRV
jgi:hypothetical protein